MSPYACVLNYDICLLSLIPHFLFRCYILPYEVRSKYFYAFSMRSHIHIYIAEARFINIHPTLPATAHSVHALLFILFHHLAGSSSCPSVCPHYRRMTGEEVNLRTRGYVRASALCLHASLSIFLAFSPFLQLFFSCDAPSIFRTSLFSSFFLLVFRLF